MATRGIERIKELRKIFLGNPGKSDDYWDSEETLESYRVTLGERIGWKWDAVLSEIRKKGWGKDLFSHPLIEWGCGPSIAMERVMKAFPTSMEGQLWDRSPLARRFSETRLKSLGFSVTSSATEPVFTGHTAIVSHVIGELENAARSRLVEGLKAARAIVWVEPGTPEMSRRLIEAREDLRTSFQVLAPCPHQGSCGLKGHKKDWCHFFADPPHSVFQSKEWQKLAKELLIDLRSLPVSYLILTRNTDVTTALSEGRVLGRARQYKGYSTALVCDANSVSEKKWLKRTDPEWIQKLKDGGFSIEITS